MRLCLQSAFEEELVTGFAKVFQVGGTKSIKDTQSFVWGWFLKHEQFFFSKD